MTPTLSLSTVVKMLNRAHADGVVLTPVLHSKVVRAASRPGSTDVYVVSPDGCTCPAGRRHRLCKHFALYVYEHLDRYAEQIVRTEFDQRQSA